MRLALSVPTIEVGGFSFAGVRCGIKRRGADLALIACSPPATVAGAFTTNRVQAAPVKLARRRVAAGRAAAVLVSAGNANACTGKAGLRLAAETAALAARLLGVPAMQVIPCATGKIGVLPPRKPLLAGVRRAVARLSPRGLPAVARAICTTDAFPKVVARRSRVGRGEVGVVAVGKGAGMIAPQLATLLVFVLTDAAVEPAAARAVLRRALARSLNALSVDGDTSTNDTVLLLASGAAGGEALGRRAADLRRFEATVGEVLGEMARLVALDGEGATRAVTIEVRGARSAADARKVARTVARSPLCRAAFHGADPNWGRLACAAGYAGAQVMPEKLEVRVGDVVVAKGGVEVGGAATRAARRMRSREVEVTLDLHLGRGRARILTTDLSPAYVRFNSAYST